MCVCVNTGGGASISWRGGGGTLKAAQLQYPPRHRRDRCRGRLTDGQ